jgi:hypothetical protein
MAMRTHRLRCALLIACASSLSLGACATQSEQVAETKWHFDGTEYVAGPSDAAYMSHGNPISSGTRSSDDRSWGAGVSKTEWSQPTSEWSQRTYVYRGGRDPKTGIASGQM